MLKLKYICTFHKWEKVGFKVGLGLGPVSNNIGLIEMITCIHF